MVKSFRLGLVTNPPLVTREMFVRYCLWMSFLDSVNMSSAEGMKGLLIPISVVSYIKAFAREQVACLKCFSLVMQLKRWHRK